MAELIIMPKLGFNMSQGKLVTWYKREGDPVRKGEVFFAVETDKTNIDMEATRDGFVRKLFVEEGDEVEVTLPIAIIGDEREPVEELIAEALSQLGRPGNADTVKTGQSASSPATADQSNGSQGNSDPQNNCTAGPEAGWDYDIAVIGGGPGGYVAAIKAAQAGKRVVLFEGEKLGGTCLNAGCIPTKVLLRSAEALVQVQTANQFGVVSLEAARAGLDMGMVQKRKAQVVSQLAGGVEGLLKGNKVTVVKEEARLCEPHRISSDAGEVTAEYIIIATGSEAKKLPVPADPGMEVLTSTEFLDSEKLPETMVVIGGGVIGIEFAYFLARAGVSVTVLEFMDRILPMVDEEITGQLVSHLQDLGIRIETSAKVTRIGKDFITYTKGGTQQKIPAEKTLLAVGRVPRLSGIPAGELGIRTERGAIVTDQTMKTSVDHIYAIGDVNGRSMLAHTASMEGIVAVANICGARREMDYGKIPSGVYTQPEVASVGLTEAQARVRHGNVKVGRFPLLANSKAKVEGEEKGLAKVIVDGKYGEILGVHLYCIHATDLIAEPAAAMTLEATAEEIALTVHPHPTVSEAVQEAFHAALGKAVHAL